MFQEIFILLIFIIINAIFAGSEIALISLNDNKIKLMAEQGHKKAKLLMTLLSEPSKFLSTIQIGITLGGYLASAFASQSFVDRLSDLLIRLPLPEATIKTIAMVIITLILSYFNLVLGELVPKRIAMKKSDEIAMFMAKPLYIISKVASPFIKLLTASTNIVVRLFGVDPNENSEEVTEEEIRMMLDVGEENGSIQADEKLMINNIFELDNKIASSIMTHRTDVVGLPLEASLSEVLEITNTEKYTRIPVYKETMDDIVGILHTKDLIHVLSGDNQENFDLSKIIRQPYFIPISKRVDDLFKEFQLHKQHMAIVIDEYGGTAGIITIEDLLEEIVGSIFDEYDEDEKEIEIIDENTFLIDGSTNLNTVKNFLKIPLPIDEYDTLNGFIISQLGRLPQEEEKCEVEFNGLLFKINGVDDKKILKVKVCKV